MKMYIKSTLSKGTASVALLAATIWVDGPYTVANPTALSSPLVEEEVVPSIHVYGMDKVR